MRLRETLNLTIDDIDILTRTIYINAEISKGKKERVVFFSLEMSQLLRRWIKFKKANYYFLLKELIEKLNKEIIRNNE